MTETEPAPDFSPCPNCGLNGATCYIVDTYFSVDTDDLAANGFEIQCASCGAATLPTQPTEVRAIELWNEGQIISAFELAREEMACRAAARDLGEAMPISLSAFRRRKPDEEAPQF